MDEKRRETNRYDHIEASFHGECWVRCHLCGKSYEVQSEYIDKETGDHFCPWCYGYGIYLEEVNE